VYDLPAGVDLDHFKSTNDCFGHATVSIGVACGAPTTAIETLIARADAALYRAKSNARNRIETEEGTDGCAAEARQDAPRETGLLARLVPFKIAPAAAA
jgi:predicted signal transduction protein with EAL and GGDEF domain